MRKFLCLFLALLLCLPGTALAATFPDVRSSASYAEAVDYVSDMGIMVGDEKGNFNPTKAVTRAEMAAVVCRVLMVGNNLPNSSYFPDVPRSHWANRYVTKAMQLGVVNGYDNGYFGPADTVTYEQAITMVVRAADMEGEAVDLGGYPYGYIAVADQNGFLDGVGGDVDYLMPRANVAVLLYNVVRFMDKTEETEVYTVYFDANGGEVYTPHKAVTKGEVYGTLPTPERDQYSFDGWYTKPGGGYYISRYDTVNLTEDQTLYAHWTANTVEQELEAELEPIVPEPEVYTVYFDANGGEVSPSYKAVADDETLRAFPTPSRSGYTFNGWYNAASGGWQIEAVAKPTKDITLYAHWDKDVCTNHLAGEVLGFEKEHPHYTKAKCKVCGETFTVTNSHYDENCTICNPPPKAPSLIWPLANGAGSVSSNAGQNRSGYIHVGTDIAASQGVGILAVASGSVISAGYNNARGNYAYIRHGDYICVYQHMRDAALIKKGDSVSQGQTIGYVGNTGESYGAHLHFEIALASTMTGTDLYTNVNISKTNPTYYYVGRGDKSGDYYALNLTRVGGDKSSTTTSSPSTGTEVSVTSLKTDGTYYSIKNKATGKVLNVYYNRSANGTNVDIYDMDYTDSVYWKFAKSGGGYVLSPKNATGSALNVYSETAGYDGCNVCIWTKSGHSTQSWFIEAVDGGYILRSDSNTGLVLTATGNKNNSNVNLKAYSAGDSYQIWNFYEK